MRSLPVSLQRRRALRWLVATTGGFSLIGCGGGGDETDAPLTREPARADGEVDTIPEPISASEIRYRVIDLGSHYPNKFSAAYAINANGEVTGWSDTENPFQDDHTERAFLWRDGVMHDIAPSIQYSVGHDINDSGQIVGLVYEEYHRPFIYHDGAMQILGAPFGGHVATALSINASGQVVGRVETDVEPSRGGFLYSDGTFHALNIDGPHSTLAINDAGWITGTIGAHALLYKGGSAIDLGTLGGPGSRGVAINARGWVIGDSSISVQDPWLRHAFLFDGERMRDLGTLGGDSSASGINTHGWVVGGSSAGGFVYDGEAMHELDKLLDRPSAGWKVFPRDINDRGEIVGSGHPPGSSLVRAVLLEPVPCRP